MTNLKMITLSALTIALLSGCGDTTVNQAPSTVTITGDITSTSGITDAAVSGINDVLIPNVKDLPQTSLSGNISSNLTLTADTLWILDGLVVIESGVTLTIEAGTVIVGLEGTGEATSYMIIDKGAKIQAEGTLLNPIIFTSKKVAFEETVPAVGLWGGLTIIGHAGNDQVKAYEVNSLFEADATNMADSSGVLRHVKILNSGISMEQDKEINGLSLIGVGSGTVIEDITVDLSDDDGIEIWGGTVNLSNIIITRCTDDYFDIDDGYSGTVRNLVVNTTTGNAGIEMSGHTHATFDGFDITTGATQAKEGGIYFKKDGIGGFFKNGTIRHGGTLDGAIHSRGIFDSVNTSFDNVRIIAPEGLQFTNDDGGGSAAELRAKFESVNTNVYGEKLNEEISGNITSNFTLTADKNWILDGLVTVTSGATLTIEAGTTIAGRDGSGGASSYMIIDKGSKINAEGTLAQPIVFTSKVALDGGAGDVGQWGGLTILGHAANDQVKAYEVNSLFEADATNMADSSGILKYVKILNSGITMEQDKEINGLSLIGVGSGTVIENITVDLSDDDGIEIWGGTVNLSNISITRCTDDYFDIDDGYSGTVTNLVVNTTTGNAGIEMSGSTAATFDGFQIITGATQRKEGAIYFKKDGIGGHFKNGTILHNGGQVQADGAIHSLGIYDAGSTSFENVSITAPAALQFTNDVTVGGSADDLRVEFESDVSNTLN